MIGSLWPTRKGFYMGRRATFTALMNYYLGQSIDWGICRVVSREHFTTNNHQVVVVGKLAKGRSEPEKKKTAEGAPLEAPPEGPPRKLRCLASFYIRQAQ